MRQFSKVVMVDCQVAGIAGDMFLAALLDLGADANKVTEAIKTLEQSAYGFVNVKVDIQRVRRKGFSATKIDVTADGKTRNDGKQLIHVVEDAVANLHLSQPAKQFASSTIRTLIEAEAKLHGNHLINAHLHEVGLVDMPAEIVGSAVALEDLGLFDAKIVASPISVGGGLFEFSHGTASSPSPAALEILRSKNFPFRGGPIEAELATPTGAAIIVNLAHEVSKFYPEMTPLKTGYGAGGKEFPQIANVLRITIGKPIGEETITDEVSVLETNIDDISGEIVGHVLEQLLSEGAKDVSIIPVYAKKNRPGQIIKVIADPKDTRRLTNVLIDETGTLGVRVYRCQRHIINRELHMVEITVLGKNENVKIKVAKDSNGKIIRIKPEYEDVKRLAEKTHIPLRELFELANEKAKETLKKR
ncbi:MAG: nickel pincer cofactor biosynthesis protein LarC [Candidatus Bathyarchaeota archaeon]|nr:nickel pincer cofactor biosynthesis protein LarC [Candidatus Bathyarchaeota archaeon]